MQHNMWIYILVMAFTTYLIRVLPLTLIRREIKNKFLRSFLQYVPYVTLSVMTVPPPMSRTTATPKAAPLLMPNTDGSASGLRKMF